MYVPVVSVHACTHPHLYTGTYMSCVWVSLRRYQLHNKFEPCGCFNAVVCFRAKMCVCVCYSSPHPTPQCDCGTALHEAALFGKSEVVKVLMQKGDTHARTHARTHTHTERERERENIQYLQLSICYCCPISEVR